MSRDSKRLQMSMAGAAVLLAGLAGGAAQAQSPAGTPHEVTQRGRAFDQALVHLRAGDTIRFNNEDAFDHQVFVQSPAFNVDTNEASPGTNTDVAFPQAGRFDVQCHIHPRMHMTVIVQ